MILLSATAILLVLYITFLLIYRFGWSSIRDFKPSDVQPSVFVTVIIPARNEETNLPTLLQNIRDQNYPATHFEVIVVDDHSTDNTPQVVTSFPMNNLVLIRLKDHVTERINSYKKKAIEVAIKRSKGKLIVTTDADCIVPRGWLRSIAAFYEAAQPSLIVMPVKLTYSNRLIEIFQAVDFMTLQGITGAAVKLKLHNMCNGANLAYTKEAFEAVEGFKGIEAIASGDDMLLMQKIYVHSPEKIYYLRSQDVVVQTSAMRSLRDFLDQRIRWASKTGNYNDHKISVVLVIVYLLNLMLLIIPVASAFSDDTIFIFQRELGFFTSWLILIFLKAIAELYFLYPVSRFYQEEKLLLIFPLLQPFHIIYTVMAGWLGKMGKYRWKGRYIR